LVAVGVFLAPLDATALSCAEVGVTAPFRSRSDVPTNTRIWCAEEQQGPTESVVLRDAQGGVVSGTQGTLAMPDVTVLVFRPDVELAPESTYTYECPGHGSEYTFTTGVGPRVGAPPVPDSSRWAARATYKPDMGDSYAVSFDSAAPAGSFVVFDIGGTASMDADGPSGVLSDVTEALYPGKVAVGSSICQNNWPEAALGASTTVALGAFDVTGAFSGWSDPVTVTLPSTLDDQSPESNTAGLDDQSSESNTAGLDAVPGSGSPLDGAPASESPRADARPLSGCGLGTMSDGSGMAIAALAAVTTLAAARRRRHRR
jgi:hypothetical protein